MNCEMKAECTAPVTHIGKKGYIYCAEHAADRWQWESTRKLRPWEIALLREGKQVPSYAPISKREAERRGTFA